MLGFAETAIDLPRLTERVEARVASAATSLDSLSFYWDLEAWRLLLRMVCAEELVSKSKVVRLLVVMEASLPYKAVFCV